VLAEAFFKLKNRDPADREFPALIATARLICPERTDETLH
jgi:hypothetical protein